MIDSDDDRDWMNRIRIAPESRVIRKQRPMDVVELR